MFTIINQLAHVHVDVYTCIIAYTFIKHIFKVLILPLLLLTINLLFSTHAVAVGGQPHKSEPSPQPSSTAPPSSPISSQGQATKPAPQAQPQVSSTTGATPAGDHDTCSLLVTCVPPLSYVHNMPLSYAMRQNALCHVGFAASLDFKSILATWQRAHSTRCRVARIDSKSKLAANSTRHDAFCLVA